MKHDSSSGRKCGSWTSSKSTTLASHEPGEIHRDSYVEYNCSTCEKACNPFNPRGSHTCTNIGHNPRARPYTLADSLPQCSQSLVQEPGLKSHKSKEQQHIYDFRPGSITHPIQPSLSSYTRVCLLSDMPDYWANQLVSPNGHNSNDSGYGGSPGESFKTSRKPSSANNCLFLPSSRLPNVWPERLKPSLLPPKRTEVKSAATAARETEEITKLGSLEAILLSPHEARVVEATTDARTRKNKFETERRHNPNNLHGLGSLEREVALHTPRAAEEDTDDKAASFEAGKTATVNETIDLLAAKAAQKEASDCHIIQWVDSTKARDLVLNTPVPVQHNSTSSDLRDSSLDTISAEDVLHLTKAKVIEVMYILQRQCYDSDVEDQVPQQNEEDFASPMTDGLESPKSSSMSASARSVNSSEQSGLSSTLPRRHLPPFDRDEDGEPPKKKPGGGRGPSTYGTPQRASTKSQMPCPMPTLIGCMGTNPTISEMLRSLQNRHRIVICTDCCTKLEMPDQERKPENVLKRHRATGCERKCISLGCLGLEQPSLSSHRRTEQCPNWKALPNELRWSFVWALLNPGLEQPSPEFVSGSGYEHSSVLTPCKEKPRERGLELCRTVMADLDVKTEQLQTLEHELETSNYKISQVQQRCDDKVANLENIIETLLERLKDNNVDIPPSLQKRLSRECPGCVVTFMPSQPQALVSPASTSEKVAPAIQVESRAAVEQSTEVSCNSDLSLQVASQSQQVDASTSSFATTMTTAQNATGELLLDGMDFDDFFDVPMDTSAGQDTHMSTWASH